MTKKEILTFLDSYNDDDDFCESCTGGHRPMVLCGNLGTIKNLCEAKRQDRINCYSELIAGYDKQIAEMDVEIATLEEKLAKKVTKTTTTRLKSIKKQKANALWSKNNAESFKERYEKATWEDVRDNKV